MKLMERGFVLPQKISAAMGMQYQDLIRHLEMAKASGIEDKLITIINSSQAGKEEQTGRTQK